MTCVKTLLLAFVALSLTLMTVAQAAQPTISHNAAVRRHNAMIEARPARRSVAVGDGKMVMQRRQTADQIAQAAALKKWDDDFHAKNAEWQQAANAALAKGQTPPSYDEYWNGKSSGSSSSDSGSTNQSSAAPAQQQQQQQQQEATTTTPSTGGSSSSSDNSGSESDECEEDATTATTQSTPAQNSTPAKGAAAAAATGSKNNAAQSNPNAGSSSSSSSQATSGKFDGQATYYAPGLGACGWTNSDSDYIVAISHSLFDSFGTGNPNNNPACGHKIAATYGGKTITVSVADRCEGCAWGDLDFTPTGFSALADMSLGRLNGLTWSWIGAAPK